MLLARLQRHAQRRFARSINRHADNAAGRRAFVGIFKGEISRVRAAEAHRHAEALGVAQGHICAHFGGRFQQHQTHHIGRHRHLRALGFHGGNHFAQIGHIAVFAHILEQGAEIIALSGCLKIAHHQFKTEIFGTGAHHIQRLRIHALIHKILV